MFFLKKTGVFLLESPFLILKVLYDFSRKMTKLTVPLTDQISLSDCFYSSRYWVTWTLRKFANQVVTSQISKLTLSFWSSRLDTWPKSQDKNLNILTKKRAFEVKWKAFFTNFIGLSVAKNCLKPESAPLIITNLIQKVTVLPQFWWITRTALFPKNKKNIVFIKQTICSCQKFQ